MLLYGYMKNLKLYILLITIVAGLNAFELALNSGGFEFGFEGKRHFKLLNSYELYIVENERVYKGVIAGLHFQWLNLSKDEFNLNFLSTVSTRYWSAKYSDKKRYVFEYGANVMDLEPEVKINPHLSMFIRKSILNIRFGRDKWISVGDVDENRAFLWEIVATSKIGIRYTF
jgi:hypothetical protein